MGTKDDVARPEDIRSNARAARRALDAAQRHSADRAIGAALLEVLVSHPPGTLASYLPTDGEVDLHSVASALRADGWRLLLPVVSGPSTMHFTPWGEHTELAPNRYGIAEPPSDSMPVQVSELDVVVLPCVAIDPDGHRLGFGAGYYDRALAGAADLLRIGVAFEVQVVDRIDARPWDVPVDMVITEQRVMVCDSSR